MQAIECHKNAFGYAFAHDMFLRPVLMVGTLNNAKSIRIEPLLTMTKDLCKQGLTATEEALRPLRVLNLCSVYTTEGL